MSNGTEIVVVESAPLSPPLVVEPGQVEVPATQAEVLQADNIEAVTDTAVEIARIEGDTAVALAEIHAETEVAAIEAASERNERDELWQTEMRDLRTDLSALGEAVTAMSVVVEQLVASSIPPALPEPVTVEVEEPTTLTITSETPPETSSETRTEALAESVEEIRAPVRRLHRMI